MGFYNKIFCVYFLLFNYFKKNDDASHTASICFLAVVQFMHFALLAGVLKGIFGFMIMPELPNKYLAAPFAILWMLFLFLYYSKRRRAKMLIEYQNVKASKKGIWEFLALAGFLIPFLLLPVMFMK